MADLLEELDEQELKVKKKNVLEVFKVFCLVMAGLRVYAIVLRNESLAG
tara:strand:- start:59 stop:205 length:147 start_codon:yes stop_codon:yes gene_type:complete